MRNRYLLGAGAALAIALGGVQAHAQFFGPYPPGAFYLGPEGGWTSLCNQNSTVAVRGPAGAIVSRPGTVNFNSGFNAGGRLGYAWGPWRFEEEYSYKFNKVSSVGNLTNTSGNVHSNAIMTNAIYDFTLGWPITPHIGAGIGAVNVIQSASINQFTLGRPIGPPINPSSPLSVAPQTFGGTILNGSGWRFGYQAIAGLRYEFSPAVALDVDYRYLGTTDQTITNNRSARYPFPNGTGGTNCCVGAKFNSSYHTNNIVASVTMKFGAPPAPPPPLPPAPPPPPPQKVFLVFFDWDKYNITPEGEKIIEVAAQQYKAGGSVKLQVTGYTDTTGSYAYNQRLSERRANAVATRMAALGVARSDMAVSGRSFNDLRVPTPAGVREPQNRRVEILFPQ